MKVLTVQARKVAFISLSVLCLTAGLLTVWTPLPTGVPLIAIGIVLAVSVSSTARQILKNVRSRSGAVDRGLVFVETKTGRKVATMLKRTRPLARKIEAKSALRAANAALQSARAKAGDRMHPPEAPRA
ncbi:hypothetical protein L1787_12410 [Acuticoccus sp. M5D2P5]|uniref:hypothetical protein n=1 Tax=Acuticoccus kalidii TaxID=2910977 RepID=UPI001F336F24|nr:hypothetical protein [Acuticoccus kalidii]MCF3934210.1 hypothetical protein [Acuticoccus kalidii]